MRLEKIGNLKFAVDMIFLKINYSN